jgi:general secretion pathway protein H
VRVLTSPAGSDGSDCGEAGFTLLEVVCVLAILALIAAFVVPRLPHGTSRTRLESYAVAAAALLKADRTAAIRRHAQIATEIDAASRLIRSGATGRVIRLPEDVVFEALLVARCDQYAGNSTIRFFPSGTSCGGAFNLTRPGVGYQVRVNWLTGGVEIVALDRS